MEIKSVHKVSFRSIILDDLIRSNYLKGNVNGWWIEQYLMALLDALSTNRSFPEWFTLLPSTFRSEILPEESQAPSTFYRHSGISKRCTLRLIGFEERRQLTPNITTLKGQAGTVML